MIYRKWKEKYTEETYKALEGILKSKYRKNKNKKYNYSDYALILKFSLYA